MCSCREEGLLHRKRDIKFSAVQMYKDHLAGSENFFLQGPKKYFLSIPFIVGVGEKKKKACSLRGNYFWKEYYTNQTLLL